MLEKPTLGNAGGLNPLAAFAGTETVLLVDDEAGVRTLISRVLTALGYTIMVAADGNEAIKFCQEKRSIDLLITDVVMPGMNGRELADRVSALLPTIKIIYMSGFPNELISNLGVQNVQSNFIEKPFTITSLVQKVRQVLDAQL